MIILTLPLLRDSFYHCYDILFNNKLLLFLDVNFPTDVGDTIRP